MDPARVATLARARAASAAERAARARRRIDELRNGRHPDFETAEEQARDAHERARDAHTEAVDIHEEGAAYLRDHGNLTAAARAEDLADANRESADREAAQAES